MKKIDPHFYFNAILFMSENEISNSGGVLLGYFILFHCYFFLTKKTSDSAGSAVLHN